MPLPSDPQAVWPPAETDAPNRAYRKWAAWWSGDLEQLAKVYQQAVGYADDPTVSATERTALLAARSRSFHGSAPARGALQPAKLHIPLAGDIAMTSADLLFGEPPALSVAAAGGGENGGKVSKVKANPTQKRLDHYLTNGLQAALLEAGEIAAAFGGVYLRVGWDAEVAEHPLWDAIAPDCAVPEFRSGHLIAVTFWRVLRDPKGEGKTWRHLERHEKGRILHGLYCSGDDKTIGEKRPLNEHPDTEAFGKLLGKAEHVDTGTTELCAQYVPNMLPNRRLRGTQLGRSDYDGIEPVMDALDESWTSWMRDLRLGKGRILVPEVYLEGQGRGRGALFDLEQEVFQVVNALPGSGQSNALAMSNVQFQIRVVEHQQTCAALTEQAVRGAGYSGQSFGIQSDGALATATEVQARKDRSMMTRGKKINNFRPRLARLALAAMELDRKHFKPDGLTVMLPDVEWPDGVATDPQTQAQTLQLLKGAEAASIRTRVETLHPDWDDDRISEEVEEIKNEGAPPVDPAIGPPGALSAPAGKPVGNAADGKPAPGEGPAKKATAAGSGRAGPGSPPAPPPVGPRAPAAPPAKRAGTRPAGRPAARR